MGNLGRQSMVEKRLLLSEGEELDSCLTELEKERDVREIAGWESGFSSLSRALNGILPGLYFLVGPPSCGKTSFAKQLLDQIAKHNSVPGIFFAFAEKKKELRIKTLARLSGVENREIRRGSAFLLHWYGVPKRQATDPEQLPASWEKLKAAAEQARSWLELTYLIECSRETHLQEIEDRIREVKNLKSADQVMVVIDDCQRLGAVDKPPANRLFHVAEQLQGTAMDLAVPILAVTSDLKDEASSRENLPQAWTERVASADVILVMEKDPERTKKLTEPNQAINLHVAKNRGGERGRLAFDFLPAFSKFSELAWSSMT